ncbi:hypothetical protein FMM80_26195 [Schaedlerella arabinosiphila]|jgi:hypothetical protein|uniref:Uncharacterized protein n=1 Tax=Schaedlerella arabinosiphila TaxID=2044587 RepID=A0A9X5H797_9FIRM|nr:hypothetical protein [Schaedlerella arabinosiphila]NDO71947.1 hypothetical protein [Schaedlerella arabinosiphila]
MKILSGGEGTSEIRQLCGGNFDLIMIRELPALKICFADGGQEGNQFAAQIGYITGGMNYGKQCESGIFGKGLSFVGA